MKPLEFLGSSRDDLRAMPDSVRRAIGLELMRVQFGSEPKSFKPMPTVGAVLTKFVSAVKRVHTG